MIPTSTLAAGYSISRIIKGGWHLAGGHGSIDRAQALRDMAAFVEAGITTFDCADIYTGVEELIGEFRAQYPSLAQQVQIHTKFVPDLDRLSIVGPLEVEAIIDRSLQRLRVERLDLVQFHWWDYAVPRHVEIALVLERLQRAGKIRHIGLTNFDLEHLRHIVEGGVPVVSHQVQYSLLDERPSGAMAEYCAATGIGLLCYGTVAGGFLSNAWLRQPSPTDLMNRSLIKYRLIIEEFGGWPLFQQLLEVLQRVALRHGVDIASVATRMVLDRPGVAAAIVGATNTAHLSQHRALVGLMLSSEDARDINAICAQRRGPSGEVYALERDRDGPHGRIMKYTLNRD